MAMSFTQSHATMFEQAESHGSQGSRQSISLPTCTMSGQGDPKINHPVHLLIPYSQEGNAEVYNECFLKEALKLRSSSLALSGKPDWECRHFLHRKAVSRALRFHLLEMEMRSLDKNWKFPVYSAYDDTAYDAHLKEIDEHRIKVSNLS